MSLVRQIIRLFWPLFLILIIIIGVESLVRFHTGSYPFVRPSHVNVIALADINGNGRLDAYLGIGPAKEPYIRPDRLFFNEGNGRFTESFQELHQWNTDSVILTDLNNDQLADILTFGPGVTLFLNSGGGNFNKGRVSTDNNPLVNSTNMEAAIADLNQDGRLDLVGCCRGQVWLNDGQAYFPKIHQSLPLVVGNHLALADLNGDSFPDLFAAGTEETPHKVWFNDGQGRFSDSGQAFTATNIAASTAVSLGDLNGDSFPDAVIASQTAVEIWFNDGLGGFIPGPQPPLEAANARALFLADLNENGRPDLVTGSQTGCQIWLNDGDGQFSPGMNFSHEEDQAFAVGDVNGDGHLDIFVAGTENYQIWRGLGDGRIIPDPPIDFE